MATIWPPLGWLYVSLDRVRFRQEGTGLFQICQVWWVPQVLCKKKKKMFLLLSLMGEPSEWQVGGCLLLCGVLLLQNVFCKRYLVNYDLKMMMFGVFDAPLYVRSWFSLPPVWRSQLYRGGGPEYAGGSISLIRKSSRAKLHDTGQE